MKQAHEFRFLFYWWVLEHSDYTCFFCSSPKQLPGCQDQSTSNNKKQRKNSQNKMVKYTCADDPLLHITHTHKCDLYLKWTSGQKFSVSINNSRNRKAQFLFPYKQRCGHSAACKCGTRNTCVLVLEVKHSFFDLINVTLLSWSVYIQSLCDFRHVLSARPQVRVYRSNEHFCGQAGRI